MDRFTYRDGCITVSAGVIRDDELLEHVEYIEGYGVFDGRHGNTDEAWIAFSRDPDTAQRICALLNADEQKREAAKQELVDQAQELNLGY
jgi:hypothetical protein